MVTKIHIKDKEDFLNNYYKLKEMCFYKEIENNKVEIKCSAPIFSNDFKLIMSKIKN